MFVPTSVTALPIPTDSRSKGDYGYNYNDTNRSSAGYPLDNSDSLPRFMSLNDYENTRQELQSASSDDSYYAHLFEAIVGEATSEFTQHSFQFGDNCEDNRTQSPTTDIEDQEMSPLFMPKSYITTPTNQLNIENSIGINDYDQKYSEFYTQYDNGNEFHMHFTYNREEGHIEGTNDDFTDIIHPKPRRSNKNVTIINEEAMYDEFLKDYDAVSLPKYKTSSTTDLNVRDAQPFSFEFPSTPPSQIGPTIPTEKYAAINAFDISEINNRGDSRASSTDNPQPRGPKFSLDSFPEAQLLEGYINSEANFVGDLQRPTFQLGGDSLPEAHKQDVTNTKFKDSKEPDFIHKLHNKLHRYFSSAGYIDKVRFQEISYRFSKTYH